MIHRPDPVIARRDWRWLPAQLLASSGVSVSADELLRSGSFRLGELLLVRNGVSFAIVLATCVWTRQLTIQSWWGGLLRVLTGGLAFVGWFGALPLLSAPVTAALLLFDAVLLELWRPRADRRMWVIGASSATVSCLVAARMIELRASVSTSGLMFVGLAIVARTTSLVLWARAHVVGERVLGRIGAPLLGGALAGLLMSGGNVTITWGPTTAPALAASIGLGLVAYLTSDSLIRTVGSHSYRSAMLLAVPLAWLGAVALGRSGLGAWSLAATLLVGLVGVVATRWTTGVPPATAVTGVVER